MDTVGNYNLTNIEFSRQVLLQRLSRPQPAIAIYPQNSIDTTLQIQVIDNATVIGFRYVASTTTTASVSFVDKSVQQVVLEINQLGLPLKAISLVNIDVLSQGDFISLGSSYVAIPNEIGVYDRLQSKGIILRSKRFTVKHKTDSKIKIVQPYFEDASLPWYPRVTNGSFTQVYKNKVYHYYIPEFDNQTWSSVYGKPFKDLKGITPLLVDNNVYQLPRTPVLWNGESMILYDGDAPISSSVIQDIDINNGLIYIDPSVTLSTDFTIDYTYLENTYIYKDININGHFSQNPLMLDKFVIIYIVPIEGSIGASKKTIYHAIGNSIIEAIQSIDVSDPDLPIAIIGAYNIQQVFSSNRVAMLDTRVKGGGLRNVNGPKSPVHNLNYSIDSNETPIENIYQESSRFWDIGHYDGEPYPGAAAVTIDLPLDLQTVLSISDIKSKASKFLAAGIYPLLDFTERQLPLVTGYSNQVSCLGNSDLSDLFVSENEGYALYDSIPDQFSGACWNRNSINLPKSLYTGDLSAIDTDIGIVKAGDEYHLYVDNIGYHQSYLKSSAIAGISWEERDILINSGNLETPIQYSRWSKKTYYDTREVATGQLLKGYINFEPSNIVKEYRNIQVNSPYRKHTTLVEDLEESISEIITRTIELQPLSGTTTNDTEIRFAHTDVREHNDVAYANNYILVPSNYYSFYNFKHTPLEEKYYSLLSNIGFDFINHGLTSGHFFKYYMQSLGYYTGNTSDGYSLLQFNEELKTLNKYLAFRSRYGIWSGDCDVALEASTGLSKAIMASSGNYGSFGPGIPIYWYYAPSVGLSGYYIPTQADLGGTLSEVDFDYNFDVYYNSTLPAILSTSIGHTGSISTSTLNTYLDAINISIESTVNTIEMSLNDSRTLSGLIDIETNWFINHNRHSSFLGATLLNFIEGYEYLYDYLEGQQISSVVSQTGASAQTLRTMFSGIERILEAGYEGLYNGILRGGVVEPDTAYSLYGYGWYVNNWANHYGVTSKTYSTDYRNKYKTLFENGLKTFTKGYFTNSNQFYETTTVNGEAGPFSISVPSKILYPLSEAVKLSDDWKAVSQGIITTLKNIYSVDGLYYRDPLKESHTPGKEYDLLKGYTKIYKNLAYTGAPENSWESMYIDLTELRGANYLPAYRSYSTSNPVDGWTGVINSLCMWKYLNTGDLSNEFGYLKEYGINTIRVPMDYYYWKANATGFYGKLDSFFDQAKKHKLRTIPVLFENNTSNSLVESESSSYYTTYGITGVYSNRTQINDVYFLTGVSSGEEYLSGIISRYDNHPSILAWDLCNKANSNLTSLTILNSCAHYIKNITDTPLIVSLGNPTKYDINKAIIPYTGVILDVEPSIFVYESDVYGYTPLGYNPNYDFIGIQPSNLFNLFIDNTTGFIDNNKIILTNYGDATYGDYAVTIPRAIDKGIPYILSNIMIPYAYQSGTDGLNNGLLYGDGTTRSSRQLNRLIETSMATGVAVQKRDFSSFKLYPTGYKPSYTVEDLVLELSSWSDRQYVDPLSVYNTGEFYRQKHILTALQSGMDTFNTKQNSELFDTQLYSTADSLNLKYYADTWASGDFTVSSNNTWLTGGVIDTVRYSEFFTAWGTYLYNLSSALIPNITIVPPYTGATSQISIFYSAISFTGNV